MTFLNGGVLPRSQRGKVDNGLMHIADWYATFSYMAGVDVHDARASFAGLPEVDSLNMWPWLMGEEEESPRTGFVISDYAIMEGDFKYVQGRLLYATWGEPVWPNSDTPSQEEMRNDVSDCSFFGCLFNVCYARRESMGVASCHDVHPTLLG